MVKISVLIGQAKRRSISLLLVGALLLSLSTIGFPAANVLAQDMAGAVQVNSRLLNSGPDYMPLRPDVLDSYRQLYGAKSDATVESAGAGLLPNMTISAVNKENSKPAVPDGSVKPASPDGSVKPSLSGADFAPALDSSDQLQVSPLKTKKNLVIMVQFTDKQFDVAHNKSYYNKLLFGSGNSMKSYYTEQSYGQFNVTGTVLGPYTSTHPVGYYATDANTQNNQIDDANVNIYELTREAVKLAKAANPIFNWADYDKNNDGIIDAVTIIHAGAGQEEVNPALANSTIWSHQWAIPGGGQAIGGGKKVSIYNMNPETGQVGVFAHEFGHVLGLPDLYDPSYQIEGAGSWDLMASGSWNKISQYGDCPAGLSAWSRHYLGWLKYTVAKKDLLDVAFPATKNTPYALQLWTDGNTSEYYFLVENRQKTGYDAGLPGEGLLIWWVCRAENYIGDNSVNVPLPSMMPIEADGNWSLWRSIDDPLSNRGDAGDPYPGTANNTAFTFTSNPPSLVDNLYTGISLWDIHKNPNNQAILIADVTVKNGLLLEPRTQAPDRLILNGSDATLDYVLLNDNTTVTVQVLNESNTVVRTLRNAQSQNKGAQSVSWDGKDDSNQNVSSGIYTFKISTNVTNGSTVAEEYTRTITVIVPGNDASLRKLTTSAGSLNPLFTTGETTYAVAVANKVASMTITPTVNESTASVTVDGTAVISGQKSLPIALEAGIPKEIVVVVTAGDGISSRTYTITVTRAAIEAVSLSGLTISKGELNPYFTSETTAYTAVVANSVAIVKVTATASQSDAIISISGKRVTSGRAVTVWLPKRGPQIINILVTSKDRSSSKSYTIMVTRDN